MVTVGRNPRCNIRIDERWDTVSNNHADIKFEDNRLLFSDHSSNGTVINGQKIHNTSVEINPGDVIKLANAFELKWDVISNHFPNINRPTVVRNARIDNWQNFGRQTENQYTAHSPGRLTEDFRNNIPLRNDDVVNRHHVSENYGQENQYSQSEIDKELDKWNWGAFLCSWLWAPFNGIYWPLFILLIAGIPYVGQVCSLCLCVYLGLNGSKLAWRSGKYSNFGSFKKIQHNWAIGGIICFIVSIISYIYILQIALSLF